MSFVLHRGRAAASFEFRRPRKVPARLSGGRASSRLPTALRVDPSGNIWTTDNGNHVVRKFSPGKASSCSTLGRSQQSAAAGPAHFRLAPTTFVISSKGGPLTSPTSGKRPHRTGLTYPPEVTSPNGEAKGPPSLASSKWPTAWPSIRANHIYVADRGNNSRAGFSTPKAGAWRSGRASGILTGLLMSGKELLVFGRRSPQNLFNLDVPMVRCVKSWGGPDVLHTAALHGDRFDRRAVRG